MSDQFKNQAFFNLPGSESIQNDIIRVLSRAGRSVKKSVL